MPCIEVAEKLGVMLLIEPEPGLLLETFGQYLQFMRRIESKAVALNFDVGHAYCVGENPEEWVRQMARFTRHYHCEDIARTREHKHLIPGRGSIDFAGVLIEIAKTGYSGWLTVELYPYIENPDGAHARAREFLLDVAEKHAIPLQ